MPFSSILFATGLLFVIFHFVFKAVSTHRIEEEKEE